MLPYINKVNLLIINQLAPLHHVSFVLFFHNFLISSLSFLLSSFLLFSSFLPFPFLPRFLISLPSPLLLSLLLLPLLPSCVCSLHIYKVCFLAFLRLSWCPSASFRAPGVSPRYPLFVGAKSLLTLIYIKKTILYYKYYLLYIDNIYNISYLCTTSRGGGWLRPCLG